MKLANDILWLSPTDLGPHLECRHATALARAYALGQGQAPHDGGEYQELIRQKGHLHELRHFQRLEEAGREILEVRLVDGDFDAAARHTLAAMRDGAEVIYQATFARDGWRGRADFLERVPGRTALGDWGYEAVDTKLARNEMLPHHVLQLGVYSRWIAQVQGVAPRLMHLELGSGRRESIPVADVAAYVRHAQASLRVFVDDPPVTEPVRCAHCELCGFRAHCEAWWTSVDHLNRVAGIGRSQIETLRAAGIDTLAALAAHDLARPVPDLAPDTLANLQWQARLQAEGRANGTLPYELRPAADGRGYGRLPEPSPGDIFLDLEGDPVWDPARELWFLFGLVLMEDGEWRYRTIWAHDPDEEQAAFCELVDLIVARRAEHPGMHVYHYSPAEPSALRRLAAQPSAREAEVDDLLRAEAFVDLYQVIRQALVIGAPSYGLKTTERLAGFGRGAEVEGGADAVVAYERWRDSDDPALLDEIARYNEEDCLATLALRDWLVDTRPHGTPWWTRGAGGEEVREISPERAARFALRDALCGSAAPGSARWLAGQLLDYHRREQRPEWWRWFERLAMSDDQLLRDGESIAGLRRSGREPWTVKRSLAYELTFPAQDHKLHADARVIDPATRKSVRVVALDETGDTLAIARGAASAEPLPEALVPGGPIATGPIEAALGRIAERVRDGRDGPRAALDLLAGAPPRITGVAEGSSIQTLDVAEQIALARDLDHSTLVVQGPPGTGKTWLGGRMIAALIRTGARVGVSAVSHKAIDNLVAEVEAAADELGLDFRGMRRVGAGEDGAGAGGRIALTSDNAACEDPALALVAGTAWLLARSAFDQALDYVVIDEAGQMALADAVAVGGAGRNLILLGDPQQLPHVSQAIHEPGVGHSVLQHVLGGAATIAPERGLFLSVTRRMHPDVCDFISREVYEGRLVTHPSCARQSTAAGTGVRHLAVRHSGRTSSSREEADAIAVEVGRLVGSEWTDAAGQIGVLTEGDIMVVAPYNAQVRLLRSVLGPGVRIGTVDRFQGQEAPVVFFSMATSTGEDMPRDVGFLFSRNRLNVAISRARCLAYLVCSPALLDARARTVDDIRLISTLCALVEEAERQRG